MEANENIAALCQRPEQFQVGPPQLEHNFWKRLFDFFMHLLLSLHFLPWSMHKLAYMHDTSHWSCLNWWCKDHSFCMFISCVYRPFSKNFQNNRGSLRFTHAHCVSISFTPRLCGVKKHLAWKHQAGPSVKAWYTPTELKKQWIIKVERNTLPFSPLSKVQLVPFIS